LSKWLNEKTLVLTTARRMAEAGLVVGTSGNVSLRLSPENGREFLAITPTSRYYDLLRPEDVPVIDFETEPVEGDLPPSSESLLHIGIYQARKNVRAIIHTHSVYASALAVAHLGIPAILEDQMASIGGEIKLAEYAPSGSDELSQNVIAALEERNAVLLMNHGMLGTGKDMREAFAVCELVEKTAKAFYLATTMGKVNLLSPEVVDSGKAFFKMLHGVDSI
jgi:L-ribulose-5-phosphate 4-epimerase